MRRQPRVRALLMDSSTQRRTELATLMVISDSVLESDWLPSIRRPRVDGLDFRAVARLPDKAFIRLT